MNNERILDISWPTILRLSVAIVCFYLLFLVRDILMSLIFALIISILFNPAVDFLSRRRIPRPLAVAFIYLGVFGLVSLAIYAIVPLFISEISQFVDLLPQYIERMSPTLQGLGIEAFNNVDSLASAFGQNMQSAVKNIFSALSVIFGSIFSTFFVVMVAAFLSAEENIVEKTIALFTPKRYEVYAANLWKRCQGKVSGWFLSRLLASLFVGVMSYVAFLLFNIKYAFSLGLLAGLFNFVPIIGPLIVGALVIIIVGLDSVLRAVFVIVVFVLIHQIESNIVTPLLSRKFMGLPAVLVLASLVIGAKLWGFLGAILSIPLAGILFEFLRDFLKKQKEENTIVS